MIRATSAAGLAGIGPVKQDDPPLEWPYRWADEWWLSLHEGKSDGLREAIDAAMDAAQAGEGESDG